MDTSSILEFKTHLSNLMRARFPFLYIPTWEEERALSVIRSAATNAALIKTVRKVFIWSVTNGMAEVEKLRKRVVFASLPAKKPRTGRVVDY